MPARDGAGPYGTGPVGRGLGPCGGSGQEPGNDQPFGMGMAHRWGRRFGNRHPRWGWRADPAYRAEDSETLWLQNRQNWLKEQLDAVTSELENRKKPSI
jgi:hypothetical protein